MRQLTALFIVQLCCSCSSTTPSPDLQSPDLQRPREAGPPDITGAREWSGDLVKPDQAKPCSPCVDPSTCCTPADLICYGDPDTGQMTCACDKLWDCKTAGTCTQQLPAPVPGGSWSCTWSSTSYKCTQPATGNPPSALNTWSCTLSGGSWVCERSFPPNPCNTPDGAKTWSCTVQQTQLVCSLNPTPPPPPCSVGTWSCSKAASGVELCLRTDQSGLPSPGSSWRCNHWGNQWVCYGESASKPQAPWACEATASSGSQVLYRCVMPADSCEKPAGGTWECMKSSSVGGTRCEKVTTGCVPGQKRWCNSPTVGVWGQVLCQANGTWKTKLDSGKTVLDCTEAGGKVPDTLCACYHPFVNFGCCERQDCVLPEGGNGQVCPAPPGNLCSYCNPAASPSQCKDTGAKCVTTNSTESYCGSDCTTSTCPTGYSCMSIKVQTGTAKQCVPVDYSCYY